MKASLAQLTRALDKPDGAVRLFLLYGPDEGGSRALATRLERAMGSDAERIDLDGATLKDDPARLPDEAAAISLFGSRRWVRVTGGEDCHDAINALLDGDVTGDPVVMLSGVLKPASALLKRALGDAAAMTFASYPLDGEKGEDQVAAIARPLGLRVGTRAAAALMAATAGNRALLERELEKAALFLDAAPDRPRDLTTDTLDAVGADLGDSDLSAIVDAVFDGDVAATATGFALTDGTSAIPLLRALGRRTLLLARLRVEIERGKAPHDVIASLGKSLFFKDKDPVTRQLPRWTASRLATVMRRLGAVEAAIKRPRNSGEILVAEEIVAIARVARSLR